MGLIYKAHRLFLYALAVYAFFLLALSIPYIQRGAIYLHWVRLPVGADFNFPEKYGITPGKVRNFYLKTPDGAEIGVWHAIPEGVYIRHFHKQPSKSSEWFYNLYKDQKIPENVFDDALKTHKTVLYSHGNAASRAQGYRTSLLRGFTNPTVGACEEGMNFVSYDYRGFADSSPANLFSPSEEGLVLDAKTVWDWIIETGAHPSNVTIAGQSLGTAVSVGLAHRLINEKKVKPKAVCLIAPFTSIPELLKTYSLFKVIPILQPFKAFPKLQSFILDKVLYTKFNTKELISSIKTSILLIHAKDDIDVHYSHSRVLFEKILENSTVYEAEEDLVTKNIKKSTKNYHHNQVHFSLSKSNAESIDFKSESLAKYGEIHRFERIGKSLDEGKEEIERVIYLDANQGGHNRVGYSETALRAMTELACKK